MLENLPTGFKWIFLRNFALRLATCKTWLLSSTKIHWRLFSCAIGLRCLRNIKLSVIAQSHLVNSHKNQQVVPHASIGLHRQTAQVCFFCFGSASSSAKILLRRWFHSIQSHSKPHDSQRNTFVTENFRAKQFGLWDWGLDFSKFVVSGGSEILIRKNKFWKLWKTYCHHESYDHYDILWSKSKCPRDSSMTENNSHHTIWYTRLALTPEKTSEFWVLDHVPGLRSFSGLIESTATSPFKIWRSKTAEISKAALTMYQNFSNHQPFKTMSIQWRLSV